jgi:hypothetical protein
MVQVNQLTLIAEQILWAQALSPWSTFHEAGIYVLCGFGEFVSGVGISLFTFLQANFLYICNMFFRCILKTTG